MPDTSQIVVVVRRPDAVVVGAGPPPVALPVVPPPGAPPVAIPEEQGPVGPPGPQGPPGPPGFVSIFAITSASSLTAHHDLPFLPRVWIVDASGQEVETDIYHTPGQVTAVFPSPFTGTLFLG